MWHDFNNTAELKHQKQKGKTMNMITIIKHEDNQGKTVYYKGYVGVLISIGIKHSYLNQYLKITESIGVVSKGKYKGHKFWKFDKELSQEEMAQLV